MLAASLLERMGLTVERHTVPANEVAAHGMISCTNLIVRTRFGSGRGPVIALNAHGDVVPPGEHWTADPYGAEVRDGVMYGRGVAVSKSDFATYAFALRALLAAAGDGAVFEGTWVRWNVVRAVCSTAAFGSLVGALVVGRVP